MDTDPTPVSRLSQLMGGFLMPQAISVAAKLGVADLLADGSRSGADLAQATGAHGPSLSRLLRMLASAGIFVEVAPDHFALTPEADLLRRDVPGSMWRAAVQAMELDYPVYGELLSSVQTGGAAFDRAFGVPMYTYLAQNADANARWNAGMTAFTREQVEEVVSACDFPNRGTIIDICGGQGAFLAAILRARPGAHGILFDRPHVVAGAPALLEAEGVSERFEVVGGDVFAAVPEGGDVYVMKWATENWEDGPATDVLKTCRRAMGTHGKLILIDPVMPTQLASRSDALLTEFAHDLAMTAWLGTGSRTAGEFERLLSAAGFPLGRILPIRPLIDVMEGIPV